MDTNQTFPAQVATNVAAAIEAAGENTKSVADATGIARMTLDRRLKGSAPFDVIQLALIADHLGTTPDAFMGVEVAA